MTSKGSHFDHSDIPLDFWDEEVRLFGVAPQGHHIDSDLAERRDISYVSEGVELIMPIEL